MSKRPETGPMQFGDDWPGVFIRGDGALAAVLSLQRALKRLPADFGTMDLVALQDLLQTLGSCRSDGAPGQPYQQAALVMQPIPDAELYYNELPDSFSAAPKGFITAADVPEEPTKWDPKAGDWNLSIQFTYVRHERDPGDQYPPTALFTCRGKDHDLDARQWRAVAQAATRIAAALEAEDGARGTKP